MQRLLPGGELSPLPDAVEAQRKASRAAVNVLSTGSTVGREGVSVARSVSEVPLTAVERTTGADVSGARETVEGRFETVQAASDRAEDRFLTVMLSTSQLTADCATLVDDSVARLCPGDEGTG